MSLFGVLWFLLEELPLVFPIKQVSWWWTRSAFVCLGKLSFLLHFWRTLLFSTVFMVGNPFSVWIYHVTLPACKLSADKSIYHLLGPPLFIISNFSLAGFKTLCFSLNFENVIIMCLCRLLWVSFFWDILGGLQKSNVHFSPQIWEVSNNYFQR